jgi:glycosyltransferase involved in cell wall biosynthesis
VAEHLRQAEAIVIAEQWPNMAPVILVEAMFLRTLVIAGKIGGIPEYIEHKRTGLLARHDDPRSYAENILWALAHKEKARDMAANAHEMISVLTDEDAVGTKLEELYRPRGSDE